MTATRGRVTTPLPGPRGRPLIGCSVEFLRDQLGFLTQVARTHGDMSHVPLAGEHVVLLNDPQLIRDVFISHDRRFKKGRGLEQGKRLLGEGLLTSEGELHRRQRRLVQPAFHRERMAGYAAIMVERAAAVREAWREGAVVNMLSEMSALTMGIVGRALFGADVTRHGPEAGAAFATVLDLFWQATLPFSELLEHLPLPSTLRFRRARARLDALVFGMIEERRRAPGDRGDLLSLLLLGEDTEGDGAGMSDTQVRDEVLTLFLAGYETTAVALTWTWYLLAESPDAARTLRDELGNVLGDRLPTADDLPRLSYARMVLAEAIRLYPPAWLIARRALAAVELGGHVIPPKWLVFMSPWVTQRDPRFYPQPERFDPSRWTPEAEAGRPPFAYFPFGGGPRQCIGERFAWTEGVLLLATLASTWQPELVSGRAVPKPSVTLRSREPILMRLVRTH